MSNQESPTYIYFKIILFWNTHSHNVGHRHICSGTKNRLHGKTTACNSQVTESKLTFNVSLANAVSL